MSLQLSYLVPQHQEAVCNHAHPLRRYQRLLGATNRWLLHHLKQPLHVTKNHHNRFCD